MKHAGKIIKIAVLALTAAWLLTTAAGCSPITGKKFDAYGYFGTLSTVAVYADYNNAGQKEQVEKAVAEIESVLAEVENAVSITAESSDVYRFNAALPGDKLEISPIAYELLTAAKKLYEYTGGNYNPAVGNLVDLWGFTPRFESFDYQKEKPYDREHADTLPEEKYIEAFGALTDFGQVMLCENAGKYYVTKPEKSVTVDGAAYGMTIDLGGIGKGYAADTANDILAAHGLGYAYVNVGTSSLRLLENYSDEQGAPDGNMWKVSLAHPRASGSYLSVFAKNEAASTSGDYERFFMADGRRYCHIIDPATGRPIDNGMATVSVFGRTAAEGDALSTALMVMGLSEAIAFVNERLTDCRVGIVYENPLSGDCEFITNMDADDYALGGDIALSSQAKDGKIFYGV